MSILRGLIGTEQLANWRFKDIRRTVFYNYPNGALPLLGLLSMMETDRETNDPEFDWFEDRWPERKTTTAAWAGGSNGPFATDAGTALATGSGTDLSASTVYRLQVAATDWLRAGAIIRINPVSNHAASATFEVQGIVVEVLSATQIRFRPLAAYTSVGNANTVNVSLETMVIGSAHSEGAVGTADGGYQLPIQLENYCQIFRTNYKFTGTELNTSATFDKTGIYKDKAKKKSLEHMIDMEWAALFGTKSKSQGTDGMVTRTSGGVLYHLKQWEAGTPYGVTASTLNTDDNKRIININGALSEKDYDNYLERLFRITNNVANEKLVVCGSGFLTTINKMYKGRSVLTTNIPMAGIWGNDIIGHRTTFGTIYYKSHPLFNQNSNLRFNALALDVNNIKYRPLANRDTRLLKNRQNNNADYREDEYLTEGGFEIRFPESHMYFTGVTDYAP